MSRTHPCKASYSRIWSSGRKESSSNHKRLSKEEFYATYTFNLNPTQKYIILFKNAKNINALHSFPPLLRSVSSMFRSFPGDSIPAPPFPPSPLRSIPYAVILFPPQKRFHPRPHLKIFTIFVPLIQREFHSRPKHNNDGKRNLHLATTWRMA